MNIHNKNNNFSRADESPNVTHVEDIPTSDDEEYDTGDSQAAVPDEHSVSAESAQQMQPNEEIFEDVEFLDIQTDEEAVKDECLEAATNQNNNQDPLGACLSIRAENDHSLKDENDHSVKDENDHSVKDESFDMSPLRASLNSNDANDSNDCVIVSEYYLLNVVDETVETAKIDEKDN